MHKINQWSDISQDYFNGTIILGNGSSIAVSPSFKYESIIDYARNNGFITDDIIQLFNIFGTCDFEYILRLLWQSHKINEILQVNDPITYDCYIKIKNILINVIHSIHPQYNAVSDKLPRMYNFLKSFDTVISLNYDLLLYWTMTYGLSMHDGHSFKDCFINGKFDDMWIKFRNLYTEETNTLVFYPHGNLALCRNQIGEELKINRGNNNFNRENNNLLSEILETWNSYGCSPLFVSEGLMQQKIASIKNSYYLSTIYREVLTALRSRLTLLGWGLGEQDLHLLKRMGTSGIKKIAVSVFHGDRAYCHRADQMIEYYFGSGIQVDFFDSESPGCWIS